MIKALDVSKSFGDIKAVDHVSVTISDGTVFGLLGTNGAGKSTFLRMLAGIYKTDTGTITLDEMLLYENVEAKKKIFYISDHFYFFKNASAYHMAKYYANIYEEFDLAYFMFLMSELDLDTKRKLSSFSKGMQKQIAMIFGISARVKYLFCDETFDGLDPVMRQAVKSIIAKEIDERGLTPIIVSHNLRELEDLCDHVGLLHKGEILLSKDLLDMKLSIYKVQCILVEGTGIEQVFSGADIVKTEQRGKLYTLIIRGSKESLDEIAGKAEFVFYELISLTLEEIFIYETEVAGYDINKLIF